MGSVDLRCPEKTDGERERESARARRGGGWRGRYGREEEEEVVVVVLEEEER